MIEISWAALHYWPSIGIIVLLCVLAIEKWYRHKKKIALLKPLNPRIVLVQNYSILKSLLKLFAWGCGWFFLWITLLQPQWGKHEETIKHDGRDIVIALDVSRSMLAQDCAPHRLAFAKEKVKRLLQLMPCERVALLLFSGSAIVQCPLTSDYATFLLFLNQLDAETISSGTTALDQALDKAISLFDKNKERKNKIIALFTDGEDFSSNLSGIKKRALSQGLQIFTYGVGTSQGAPIPVFDERGVQQGHQRDARGTVVISRLNEGILKSLAHESGGIYIQMRPDDRDIQQLVDRVSTFEREKFADKVVTSLYDRYHYSAALSFLFFLLEWLL